MTRRLHRCHACVPTERNGDRFYIPRGFTRHRDRICSWCRARGIHRAGDEILVPLVLRAPVQTILLDHVADPTRPTLAEIRRGVDLTGAVEHVGVWYGTDCPCSSCAGDRIPGRYA